MREALTTGDVFLDHLGPENRAFIRALRQGAFQDFPQELLETWGRLTFQAKQSALLPWYNGEVSQEKLPVVIADFRGAIQEFFESGEVRY